MRTFSITYQDIGKTESLILSTRITSYLSLADLNELAPLKHFLLKENIFSIGKIKREDYKEKGEFPVVDQSKDFIVGYSDEDSLVYNGKLPVIVFGDHTRVFKYVDFPFIQGADGIQIIAPDPEVVNPKFFYYLLKYFGVPSRDYNRHFSILKKQRYPVISKNIQDETISKIEPIEREIQELQSTISDPAEAISHIFAGEFGFDLAQFEELKRQKIFSVDLRDCANNDDLRFSVKFHRQAAKFVESELRSRTDKSIKDFLAEDIVLGASVSPDDYDDYGEFYYVAMSSIKSWGFDKENAHSVSAEYVSRNQAKSVKKDDIIMARSGEGTIGKVALIEGDEHGIFADFTMRIRLRGYDAEFAYYYFRTQYMQYLIETHKKGLGNNTNIFPNQIKEFPMLNVPRETQTRLVKEIRAEFSTQDKIKRRIEAKRGKIDEMLRQLVGSISFH